MTREVDASQEATKVFREDARAAEKLAATLSKENKVALQRLNELENELVAAKPEASTAVESYKKTLECSRTAEEHCLAKKINIYGDLVKQIQGI